MIGLIAILAVAGALFPLVGVSLVVMLGLDMAFTTAWRSRRGKRGVASRP
jgi:uncharacterized iron-regulated membrane protein